MSVNERVKDAPANVLRAMFAGIGQLLGMADKLRKSAAAPRPGPAAPRPAAPGPAAPEKAAAETAGEPAAETAAETAVEPAAAETASSVTLVADPAAVGGHVKLVPADDVAAAAEPAVAETAAEPAVAETAAPAAAADLPLANYDELTIASLRARLRNLSADQLGQLIEYEKGHAGRADVITMFERRIAKLAEG